ncbi:MAG TPA: hypothetical protein VN783_00625 [Thermoanaerobaculia bacterium]|nr:hypothetical protein [Thermoanaerobaculia bacterium]
MSRSEDPKRDSAAPRPPGDGRLREALALLAAEVEARIARHPGGHLIAGRGEAIAVDLRIPSDLRDGRLEPMLRLADAAIDEALADRVRERTAFRPGRAFCLRCGSADCEHAAAPDARFVFSGYGPTGLPRFADFAQLALARRDPRIETLFREPPGLLALALSEADLTGALLAPFSQREDGFRLLGQVSAGWFRVRSETGVDLPFAITLQVLSVRGRKGRRRLALNLLGAAPGGGPLEDLYDRLREIPWLDAVRWAQAALANFERSLDPKVAPRSSGRTSEEGAANERAPRRLQGIIDGLARRLEKDRRARDRRTSHAEHRHGEGDRPTGMALADLGRAAPHEVLVDARRDTLVVLGERGRAHVFNRAGRHVTSVRLAKDALAKRRERDLWRPARPEEIQGLLAAVKAMGEDDREPSNGSDASDGSDALED